MLFILLYFYLLDVFYIECTHLVIVELYFYRIMKELLLLHEIFVLAFR